MKNRPQIRILCLALGLAIGAVSPGCATVGPIAVKCGPEVVQIAAADYNEISTDLHARPVNYTDLVKVAERIGWAIFDCVTGDQVKQDPSVAPAVQEFKRQNAAQFRAAGVSCNVSPVKVLELDKLQPSRRVAASADTGGTTLASCAAACGTPDAIAPPDGCRCWHASRTDWRKSRWMALR